MIDKYGLYVQADGDGGDASHRSGLAAALHHMVGDRSTALNIYWSIRAYLHYDGTFVRHPDQARWWSRPDNFSRDQASRIILAFAVMGKKDMIKLWLVKMAGRLFFHQNNTDPVAETWRPPDLMAPGEWRNVIRGLEWWWAYPLLILLDATFLTDIYFRAKWDGGSLFVPDLYYAQQKYPTFFSRLAWKKLPEEVWDEIKHNHSLEKNGCVELIPLFEKLKEQK